MATCSAAPSVESSVWLVHFLLTHLFTSIRVLDILFPTHNWKESVCLVHEVNSGHSCFLRPLVAAIVLIPKASLTAAAVSVEGC